MTDFGLKYRRFPEEEALPLDEDLSIAPDVLAVLTNFQIEALRFLWSHLKAKKSDRVFYNDGKRMGKRITLVALLKALIQARGYQVLIACDTDEAIVRWIYQLDIFGGPAPEFSVFSVQRNRRARRWNMNSSSAITFTNFSQFGLDLNKLILQNDFKIVVMDTGAATDVRFKLDLPEDIFLIVVSSLELSKQPRLLKGMLRTPAKAWPTLRRTNEEHLREFPWLDQRRFLVKFEEWKGHRTINDILSKRDVPKPILVVDEEEVDEEMPETPQKPEVEEKVVQVEDSQVMSQLLFETDDEGTPVKRQDFRRSVHSSLLSSMYLRVSQSFTNTTPQQKIVSAKIVQDSPDLFASILTDDDEDHGLVDMMNGEVEEEQEDEDTTNPFDKSTPLGPTAKQVVAPSQSPISSVIHTPNLSPLRSQADMLMDPDHSDVFEITANEVFANKIKITSQRYVPVDDDVHLKFSEDDNAPAANGGSGDGAKSSPDATTTPTKKGKPRSANTTPSTRGAWLSKRTTPKIKTPEKVLAKKRRGVLQFYAAGGSGGQFRGNLDFAALEDQTQRWDAC